MSTNPNTMSNAGQNWVEINLNLAASSVVTWTITSPSASSPTANDGASWAIASDGPRGSGFTIKPASSTPLSLGQLSVSPNQLSVSSGASALACIIRIHMNAPADKDSRPVDVKGTTSSSDSALTASANMAGGADAGMEEDWSLSFTG